MGNGQGGSTQRKGETSESWSELQGRGWAWQPGRGEQAGRKPSGWEERWLSGSEQGWRRINRGKMGTGGTEVTE